jgi:hypothetical protein
LFHDGRYWLFTAIRDDQKRADSERLYLFHTTNPVDGEWKSHPVNPVVSDPDHARPAGCIYPDRKVLYRPTQYFRGGFAYGMKISKIETLDRFSYSETVVHDIRPDLGVSYLGIHTINHSHGLTIMDARLKRNRLF